MIKKLEISGVRTEVTEDLNKYIVKKIGKLDEYMSRHARQSVHAEVVLRESKSQAPNKYECEVILYVPQDTITAKEATMNMFAAIDIVESKLRNQLKKYKESHGKARLHRRILARLRRRTSEDT